MKDLMQKKKITDEKKWGWTGRAKYTLAAEACKYITKQARGENEVFFVYSINTKPQYLKK